MFYVHKDDYPNDRWWKGFTQVLNNYGLSYRVFDLHNWNNFENIKDKDYLLARLGHVKSDKNAIKPELSKIYSSWSEGHVFPPRIAYNLYDDKWKEYKFLKSYNLPTLKTSFVENKRELSTFLSDNCIDFPIVLKKSEGAGSKYVWRFSSMSEIDNDIFPILAQNYFNVDFDIRLFYLNGKFFGKRRFHKNKGSFPYGTFGVVQSERIKDIKSVLGKSFLRDIWEVFYLKHNIPTMCFDLLNINGKYSIIEFSYCFNYKITLDCSHYYNILDSESHYYYDDGDFKEFQDIKYMVSDEILKWVTNDNLDAK